MGSQADHTACGRLPLPHAVPPRFEHEYAHKPLVNRFDLREWLRTIGPHLFCCGHIHAAWAYRPDEMPNQAFAKPRRPLDVR